MWKHLVHPNIVPLKGVTLNPPQLVSEWMPGGEIRQYARANPELNLVNLVGTFFSPSVLYLIPPSSYSGSPMVLLISTHTG